MAFSLCSTKTLLLLFLISAIPVAFIISSELAKPQTHVYHYHSSGFFRECAKWDDLNRRFLVSFIEGGIGEIAVPEDHGSSSEEAVLKEVTVVKDPALAGNSSLGIVVDRPRNRLLVAISDLLGNKYNALVPRGVVERCGPCNSHKECRVRIRRLLFGLMTPWDSRRFTRALGPPACAFRITWFRRSLRGYTKIWWVH